MTSKTLRRAVEEFLAMHDRYETFAKYKISYGAQKDVDMHIDEMKAIAILREIIERKSIKSRASSKGGK